MVPRALGLLCVCAATCFAELPVIRLDTVYPPGAKAGSDLEVALTGTDLDGAAALHFSHPGITGTPKDKRFVVKVAADVPPGVYDVRVSGNFGVSNPRAFVVSDLPQSPKPGANSTPETALEFPIDTTIAGTATAAAADWFKFTAKKGQRLLIDCDAGEIDSRLNPVLTISEPGGRELATNRRGGLLDFAAPADGTYLLKLNELTFAGGADYFYRLTLTTGPRIDYVFPPSGKAGTKAKFTLFGRNLPGGSSANLAAADGRPLDKLDVEIDLPSKGEARADGLTAPAATAVDGFSFRLKSPHASNPVFIGFTNEPIVAEQEPNNQPAQAQKLTPPCEVAGQFFPAADVDTYVFDAKKGEVWWLEVISQRLDLPTNPFFVIERDGGASQEVYGADTNLGGPRFSTTSTDPSLRFEVKEDGAYRVRTRDLFGTARKDPRAVYRLAIRREVPDFRLLALGELPQEKKDDRIGTPRATVVRGDGTTGLRVLAFRRDGFAGDIVLSAEGLPPSITCPPVRVAAGANEATLLFTGVEKPERWAGSIRVIGKAKVGDQDVVREARGGAVRWPVADANTDAIRTRLTRDIAVGIATEAAPISIAATADKPWEVAPGAKVEIPLKVTRRGEFKEALKLKAFGAPGIEALKAIDVAANAPEVKAVIDLATAKIPAGEHVIHFEAQTKGKVRGKENTTTVFSAPIRLVVQAPLAKQTP